MRSKAEIEREAESVVGALSSAQTERMINLLLQTKQRADAGVLTSLEAGVEQLEAILLVCPDDAFPELRGLVSALRNSAGLQ